MPLTLLLLPALTRASCSSGVITTLFTVVATANCAAVIGEGVGVVGVGDGAGAGFTITSMAPAPGDATSSAPHAASRRQAVPARKWWRLKLSMSHSR